MNSAHEYAETLRQKADALMEETTRSLSGKKRIISNSEDREVATRLKRSVNTLAEVVTSTLGPKGRNVMFDLEGEPVLTKDGVTVAKSLLPLEDSITNLAVQLVVQAAEKTAYLAGDGTTTTVALTNSLVNQFYDNDDNPYKTKKEMELAFQVAKSLIKKHTRTINKHNGLKYIENIAYTSANNDEVIAAKIKNIYKHLKDWNTEVNFTTTSDSVDVIELVNGYKIHHKSPSVKDKKLIIEKPNLVLCNFKITDWNTLLKNAVNNYMTDNTPTIFVVRDYVEDMPKLLQEQAAQYRVPLFLVKVDSYGSEIPKQFSDLCYANEDTHILTQLPEEVRRGSKPDYILELKQAILTPEESYLVFTDEVTEYHSKELIPHLLSSIKEYKDKVEIKNINDRITKLRGVTCNYYIGGTTAAETNEKFYRIEDALLAVRSAIKYGIITGGSVVYQEISTQLPDTIGANMLAEALQEPLRVMCRNAGLEYSHVRQSLLNTEFNMMYDFSKDIYTEVSTTNIYDSAQTALVSIENAISIATQIFLTSNIIYK